MGGLFGVLIPPYLWFEALLHAPKSLMLKMGPLRRKSEEELKENEVESDLVVLIAGDSPFPRE